MFSGFKKSLVVPIVAVSLVSVVSCDRIPFLQSNKNVSRTALSIYSPVVGGGENGLENPRTEFAINEKIWVTYDVKNITAVKEDGTSSFWLRQDLIIRDKKGNVVVVQPGVLDVKKPVAEKPARFVNEISLAGVEGLKPGRYEITLLVTDVISFKTVSETVFIKIK